MPNPDPPTLRRHHARPPPPPPRESWCTLSRMMWILGTFMVVQVGLNVVAIRQVRTEQPRIEQSIALRAPSPQRAQPRKNPVPPPDPPGLPPVPKTVFPAIFRTEQDRIDAVEPRARCARFGTEPLPPSAPPRRIFYGSLLADENKEVLLATAAEVFNKYAVVALVESNRTFFGTHRDLNYGPGSAAARQLVESEFFGTTENTKVVIDYWTTHYPGIRGQKGRKLDAEHEQRNVIRKIWTDQGMTDHDIGLLGDLDEIPSRDVLNALAVCDFPQLRYDKNPSCHKPKMILSSMSFEGSPLCLKKMEWHHPDIIPGFCLLGIGNPIGRTLPERSVSLARAQRGDDLPDELDTGPRIMGDRADLWGDTGSDKYPKHVIESNFYPLWSIGDIRRNPGDTGGMLNYAKKEEMGHGKTAMFAAAYHFHNWFEDIGVLRHKYTTYGHGNKAVKTWGLAQIDDDLALMMRCVHGLGNRWTKENGETVEVTHHRLVHFENNTLLPPGAEEGPRQGWGSIGGNRPIYFSDRDVVVKRDAIIKEWFAADEPKFGIWCDHDTKCVLPS